MKTRFIGKLIEQLREEHQISIEELSARSSVATEKLVEIEKGNVTPSIGVMIKISRALGARLGTLLDGSENIGAVVTRATERKPNSDALSGGQFGLNTHMDFFSLGEGKKDRAMEPMIVELQPTKDAVSSEHEGEEFIYVLKGIVEVHYGKQIHTLTEGDSIYYDSIVPHKVFSGSDEGAQILAVIYTPY